MRATISHSDGSKVQITQCLHLNSDNRLYPPAFQDNFGLLGSINGVDHLIIPRELIHAYKQARELRETQTRELSQLHPVMERFSIDRSIDRPDRFDDVPVDDLIWFPPDNQVSPEIKAHIVQKLLKTKVRPPGYLEIGIVESGSPDAELLPAGSLY